MNNENTAVRIIPGTKYFRFKQSNPDVPEVIRVRSVEYDKKIVRVFDSEGNNKKVKLAAFINSYTKITPDGTLFVNKVPLLNDDDVIISIKNLKDNREKSDRYDPSFPYAICRQMVEDVFTKIANPDKQVLGICVSQDTCPVGIRFGDFLVFCGDSVTDIYDAVSVYVDDTLDEMLKFVRCSRYDSVFKSLKDKYGNIKGLCNNVKELLISNNFMFDFRKCFGIYEIPFDIDDNSDCLSELNTEYLEKELNINIDKTYVMRYSNDINLSEFKRDYVLVAPSQSNCTKLYIVGYDHS